jgi:putative sterol carrier protein
MPYDKITTLSSISSALEETWQKFDAVYATLSANDWTKKFSKTWIFADQPYHLMYFDKTIADFIVMGENIPPDKKLTLRSLKDINDWNAREFAKRPTTQTPEQSLAQMREARNTVRKLITGMNENDLTRKAWMHLLMGWVTVRDLLTTILVHNIAEYQKLWVRTAKRGPALSPSLIHLRLAFVMNFMGQTFNKEAAVNTQFTMTWNFTGDGGGAWTFHVADGMCTLKEEMTDKPDLIITMKPETLQLMLAKFKSPFVLMLTGEMKVKGFSAMGKMNKLFPEPKPEQVVSLSAEGLAVG